MRASFSSWLQLAGWTADVPAAASDMHEEGSDRHATRAPRMPASLASPGAGFSADGAVRKEQCALRSCRDAARDSAMCPMAGRAAGMAQAAFQQCSMMSGRCPSISDIPRQLLHSAEAAFPDMPEPAERERGPELAFGGLYGGLEQPLPAHACPNLIVVS